MTQEIHAVLSDADAEELIALKCSVEIDIETDGVSSEDLAETIHDAICRRYRRERQISVSHIRRCSPAADDRRPGFTRLFVRFFSHLFRRTNATN